MSIFNSASAPCPVCDTVKSVQVVASVNADRRPDLRQSILAGEFQSETCDVCKTIFKFPPQLTYLDLERQHWIMTMPAWRLAHWQDAEAAAMTVFRSTFGAGAPKIAQSLGRDLRARLVFGWPAFREKLLADDLKVDDIPLELLKISILANTKGFRFGDNIDLRLTGQVDDNLVFGISDADREAISASLQIPRDIYDGIAENPGSWEEIHQQLNSTPFVDLSRFVVASTPTPQA